MKYNAYTQLFNEILNVSNPRAPYNDSEYFNYTKLNESRMKRWTKTMELDSELIQLVKNAPQQHWVIITEPWCGDAAHIVPFLVRIAESSDGVISYELQLRDSAPFLIDSYLTNGAKAIPKLISRDEHGKDLFVWGPRPAGAQQVMTQLKNDNWELENIKIELQNWYNNDKGKEVQNELKVILKTKSKKSVY